MHVLPTIMLLLFYFRGLYFYPHIVAVILYLIVPSTSEDNIDSKVSSNESIVISSIGTSASSDNNKLDGQASTTSRSMKEHVD